MIIGDSEALSQYLQRLNQYPRLNPEEEKNATPDQLVLANLRLVVHLAKRWARTAEELLERIQDGNIGLLIVSKKFDPSNGARFSTYAAWYITDEIRKGVLDMTRTVRTPRHVLKNYKEILTLFEQGLSESEIAKQLGLKDYSVSSVINYKMASSDEFPELIDGEYEINVDLIHTELRMRRSLSPTELYVVQSRLEGFSQEEIGAQMNVSNSRVQQIEQLATHKLRAGYVRPRS